MGMESSEMTENVTTHPTPSHPVPPRPDGVAVSGAPRPTSGPLTEGAHGTGSTAGGWAEWDCRCNRDGVDLGRGQTVRITGLHLRRDPSSP